jgi:hypothetical protein
MDGKHQDKQKTIKQEIKVVLFESFSLFFFTVCDNCGAVAKGRPDGFKSNTN